MRRILVGAACALFLACWFYSDQVLVFFYRHHWVFGGLLLAVLIIFFIALFSTGAYFKTKRLLLKSQAAFDKNREWMSNAMQATDSQLMTVIHEKNKLMQQMQVENNQGLQERIRVLQQWNNQLNNQKKRLLRDLRNCRARIKR
jgi:hypothetical protein